MDESNSNETLEKRVDPSMKKHGGRNLGTRQCSDTARAPDHVMHDCRHRSLDLLF